MSKVIQFIIGDDKPFTPLEETTVYENPCIAYKSYTIYKNGFGFLFEGVHFSKVYYGGFSLLGSAEFEDGEMYTITLLD